jgi:hypothetical protein
MTPPPTSSGHFRRAGLSLALVCRDICCDAGWKRHFTILQIQPAT